MLTDVNGFVNESWYKRTKEKEIFPVVIVLSHNSIFHKCIEHLSDLDYVIYTEEEKII